MLPIQDTVRQSLPGRYISDHERCCYYRWPLLDQLNVLRYEFVDSGVPP